jgi:hypothetical protein
MSVRKTLVPAIAGSMLSGVIVKLVQSGFFAPSAIGDALHRSEMETAWILSTLIILLVASTISMILAPSSISLPRQSESSPYGRGTADRRHSRSSIILIAVSASVSTLLAICAIGSVQHLADAQQGAFIGAPASLLRIYIFFSLDDDYLGPEPLSQFRRDMQRRYELVRDSLMPLSSDGIIGAGYPALSNR